MIVETFISIEVENVPNIWAVDLQSCKEEMKPAKLKFIAVNNSYINNKFDYVEQFITDTKPEKIINGVNGGISDDYKEAGFWRIKKEQYD